MLGTLLNKTKSLPSGGSQSGRGESQQNKPIHKPSTDADRVHKGGEQEEETGRG